MKKRFISLLLIIAFLVAILPTSALAYNNRVYNPRFSYENINVYYDRVSGVVPSNSTVRLYKGSRLIGTDSTTSDGTFEISNNFYHDSRYWYDDRYSDDRYFEYYYDLSDYYLIATRNGIESGKYYLSNRNVRDYSYWYPRDSFYPIDDRYLGEFKILEANPNSSVVRGIGGIPYGTVVIRDSNQVQLGSENLGADGTFAITTNRPLKDGEFLKAITSAPRYNNRTTTFVVTGITPATGYIRYNYVNQYTIGSKAFLQTIKGATTTQYMDVAPYITNGRTMLPIRFVAEALGYTVKFDEVTRNAVFLSDSDSVVVNLDSRDFFVNGNKYTLSVDPITVNGRIMLPVSEIGTALGLTHGNIGEGKNIEWDGKNKVVIIQSTRPL